jgi:hypothetical protein
MPKSASFREDMTPRATSHSTISTLAIVFVSFGRYHPGLMSENGPGIVEILYSASSLNTQEVAGYGRMGSRSYVSNGISFEPVA